MDTLKKDIETALNKALSDGDVTTVEFLTIVLNEFLAQLN